MDTNQVVIQDFVINACVDHFIGATEEQKKRMLDGILNSMNPALLEWLRGEMDPSIEGQNPDILELEQRVRALRPREDSSDNTNVDPTSASLLDESIEVVSSNPNVEQDTQSDVNIHTGFQNPSSQPVTWPYGEWIREAEARINPEQGQQVNPSNPESDPDLAELQEDMDANMNWGDFVTVQRGQTRKKKTKKKRRKSKKKKKPYEDLIMTQKKRLAKLQKMSEKLSKKMSKTKKKKRKKKVSDDSY